MIENERKRAIAAVMMRKEWKPNDISKPLSAKAVSKAEKRSKEEEFKENAFGAFEEVVRMAEASGKIELGRNTVTVGRYRPSRSRR